MNYEHILKSGPDEAHFYQRKVTMCCYGKLSKNGTSPLIQTVVVLNCQLEQVLGI